MPEDESAAFVLAPSEQQQHSASRHIARINLLVVKHLNMSVLLVVCAGPTPGVVRDLFKQHFRSLDAGTGSWLSGPSPDDSTGGQHAVTLMEHRRSLSSL
jgi:hypothetical protein